MTMSMSGATPSDAGLASGLINSTVQVGGAIGSPCSRRSRPIAPRVCSQTARVLAEEKEMTRARDALSTRRRELPMVEVDKPYVFEGLNGDAGLLDLFEGRSQLIVGHFMFDPSWTDGCSSCSAGADEVSKGLLDHLHARETSFTYVSRAPLAKIEGYKARTGWTFPWYSSFGSDFNYDFHVTMDESVTPVEYNYRTPEDHEQAGTAYYFAGEQPSEQPGTSCFLRDGDRVFHT